MARRRSSWLMAMALISLAEKPPVSSTRIGGSVVSSEVGLALMGDGLRASAATPMNAASRGPNAEMIRSTGQNDAFDGIEAGAAAPLDA